MAIAFILGHSHAYSQNMPAGHKATSNYLESFTETSATYSSTTLPPGWYRLEDKGGNISYSMTRENGGHQGKAIGQTKSQSNVRSGDNTVDFYDYIVTPQVKGTITFWVARYSTGSTPQVEVYRMTKTDNGFLCDPKTDLLFSVNENSWPQYTNSNPSGWIEQTFDVGSFEHLGFRISNAYIDEFEAAFAVIPDNGKPIADNSPEADTANAASGNKATVNGASSAGASVGTGKSGTVRTNHQETLTAGKPQSKSGTTPGVTPYFSANTIFMITDPSPNRFSQVTDSVFAINTGGKYEFWTVTGQKLYDAMWTMPKDYSSSKPQFDGGVVAMRMAAPNAAGQKPVCLLYLDGTVKELDPAWKYVSKFEDGLALAEDGNQNWFYINAAGKKMYPGLTVYSPVNDEIRPMREGLRAFYGGTSNTGNAAWGFIDSDGHVVIPPKYSSVTDFSDGYAWVVTKNPHNGVNTKELIDARGNVAYRSKSYTSETSDVADGVFIEVESQKAVYKDISGTELASFTDATIFYDRRAFVQTRPMGGNVSVINPNFQTLRELPNKILAPSDLKSVNFEPFGLSTINGIEIITPDGDVLITEYGTGFENRIGSFGQFSECGYATAEGYINSARCFFYIKPTGEIAWLFSDSPEAGGPWNGGNPPFEPEPIDPPGPIPHPIPRLPPVDKGQTPRGPKMVETVKFTVEAIAVPGEGGRVSVTPRREFEYGEPATLNAAANKDWALSYIEYTPLGSSKVENGKPFKVTSDMTVIAHFVKKDDESGPDKTGCFLGMIIPPKESEFSGRKEWEIPVYAEISEPGMTESPYGDKNYGFLVPMFDPSIEYTSVKGDLSCNFFAAPLKISGFHKDKDGRSWMVVDGGSVTSANISAGANPLTQMVFGAMLGLSGMSNVATDPRHYRIEMLDIDSETGEFTFGELQTYSLLSGGWVTGGAKEITNRRKGAFATYYDSGYSADFFQGVRMKASAKRNDVQWYPPQNWFDDKSIFEKAIESMREGYGSAKSDYERLFSK